MSWKPRSLIEGLRMAWDDDSDGVTHCLRYIKPHLPKSGGVLDIGCGVGRLAVPIATLYPKLWVEGFDTSPEMIAQAMPHERVTYHTEWSEGRMFDMAYSVLTFQHITDSEVRQYLERVKWMDGAPFVFQFVEGTEREPLSMQRDPEAVMDWCVDVGYDVIATRDSHFRNWWWFTCE